MAEDISGKKKNSLSLRLIKCCLLSPVNTVLSVAVLYFAARVYFFDSAFSDKFLLCGAVGLWIFWFVAKHIFTLLLVLLLLGGGAYAYYHYSRQEAVKCEDAGGYWNDNTKTCEARRSLREKIRNFFIDDKKTEN